MWYEILINGYSWFTNQLTFENFQIAESIGGVSTEPKLSINEAKQIREQLDDYKVLGFNKRLLHLNRSGITKK